MEIVKYPEHLVFGLDIGTRSIVGTVGYRDNSNQFIVVAQCVREHETRAMMDGQIHDIYKVSDTIRDVKENLEDKIGRKLTDVCIAAAGRVLKTVNATADYEFTSETVVNEEHIHSLNLIGVEKAYNTLREELKEDKINFYCVGYTVISYELNGYSITNLNGHKANKIGTKLIATFLPDEVINGLYAAVEAAELQVACLTLEPIAAINLAIPEKYRLLNIAMVDVGAGTSDISLTKDGSIIGYGMIPYAGDEITEAIAQKYLVEFSVAETMKTACLKKKSVSYKDIMGIKHKISTEEIMNSVSKVVHKITKCVADKIIELNGGRSVSAVFVIGGGGKLPGFVESLSQNLNLPQERVAIRGEEVLSGVTFRQEHIKKDSLLVTPIGICLSFYDQTNNFIFVTVNKERVKLYDNNKLTIADAAIQIGYPNEKLFPRRGKPINFTVNGNKRMVRGELGEAARIKRNGEVVGISQSICQNDIIEIVESTVGADAVYEIRQLPEYHSTISIQVNGVRILCPKFAMANGELVSGFYSIQDKDDIQILDYYTLKQVLEFMDIDFKGEILVNNVPAAMDEKIYEHFSIQCNIKNNSQETYADVTEDSFDPYRSDQDGTDVTNTTSAVLNDENMETDHSAANQSSENESKVDHEETNPVHDIYITVNSEVVKLSNKSKYIFVDVFDFYPFDLSKMGGSELVTKLNGERAEFTAPLMDADNVEIFWK